MKRKLVLLAFLFGLAAQLPAAVGCDLRDPDRDVKRLFPGSTGYKTAYKSIDKLGGEALLKMVEDRLGDKFTGLYEKIDVPYTLYTVLKGKETIGYIHGINQKGQYGGLQVFLAYDPQGVITNFYYQKLTSRDAKAMNTPAFAAMFKGLSFENFRDYDPINRTGIPNGITGEGNDFYATLRAVKKNCILMDIFVFGGHGRQS